MQKSILILAIESSCDDTSCAVLSNDRVLSNVTAGQTVHEQYGGVIPELASRDHQKNIIPVVHAAMEKSDCTLSQLNAIAVTSGPGLLGSLLVGTSFAKSLSLALGIPLITVNHMQGHILAHFIREAEDQRMPEFPFICLTVSGGHTQIIRVDAPLSFTQLGATIDDAVGEAFDKAAKIFGLPYPGGPEIDRLAKNGDPSRFQFSSSNVPGYDYSFSGIKTSFLYFIRDGLKTDKAFIEKNLNDICASYQRHLIEVLLKKVLRVLDDTGIRHLAIAGGVSANSELRAQVSALGGKFGISVFIPRFEYCTDNAAMIGITAYYKYLGKHFDAMNALPQTRLSIS